MKLNYKAESVYEMYEFKEREREKEATTKREEERWRGNRKITIEMLLDCIKMKNNKIAQTFVVTTKLFHNHNHENNNNNILIIMKNVKKNEL